MMNDNKPSVHDSLKDIFIKRFNRDIGEPNNPLLDLHLLGKEIGLNARDLLYIYFDIKEQFGFPISGEDIAAGKMRTINQIKSVIEKQLLTSTAAVGF